MPFRSQAKYLLVFKSYARAAIACAAIFSVVKDFTIHGQLHNQMKNEIMSGNQHDHVTLV